MKLLPTFNLGLLLLTASFFAEAHHSFAGEFDPENKGELSGTISDVRWTNPHVIYTLDVDGESWVLQTHNIVTLLEHEWNRDTIQVGDEVRASGALGRNGTKRMSLDVVNLSDGRVLNPAGGELATAYQLKEVTAETGVDYGVETNDYPVDITGIWDNRYNFVLTVDDLTPKPIPFTAAGRAEFESREAWQDPSKLCRPSGLPRTFGAPRSMEIVDAGDYYLMLYGAKNQGRRIWMDGREAPEGTALTSLGYSVGHWEGEQLVIETTHLLPSWLDGSGLPMTGGDGTRIVETYTPSDDGLTMERKMVIHDDYYTEPLTRMRGSARGDVLLVEDPPCDVTDYLESLREQGLLDDLLAG